MTGAMYTAVADPYCYPGSTVLKNIPGFRVAADLERFEAAISTQRADEPFPPGRLSVRHYCTVHRHLFQDVYRWAGRFRTVRISKDNSVFCYPENIGREMSNLFGRLKRDAHLRNLSPEDFSRKAASFLADLNAIHCFRDGNGRAQLSFMALLANRAGYPLKFQRLEPTEFLRAMVRSFGGDLGELTEQLTYLTT